MSKISVCTYNELVKIFSRKKYIIVFIIELLLCLAVAILGSARSNLHITNISIDIPNLPFVILPVITSVILPLVIFMMQSDMFSGEFENGSIKSLLLSPISRFKIYVAKNLAAIIYTLINVVFVFVITILLKLIFKASLSEFFSAFASYLISIVPLICIILMASLISILVNNSSMSMFLSIGLYILFMACGIMFPALSTALFTSHIGWYKMWIGAIMPLGSLVNVAGLMVSYITLFFILGYMAFDSKEV